MKPVFIYWAVILVVCLLLQFLMVCQPATKPPDVNLPPITAIANIPVPGDTLFPLVNIYWDGGDNDGYITGCQYRYTTYHLDTGDSVHTDWVNSSDDVLTIIFESSDRMNKQHFYVRAVDDKGAVDPSPAKLVFYTPQTVLPKTEIIAPLNNTEFFYLEQTTDWWQGISLIYTAFDQDGEVVEYGWSVDGNDFFWTQDTVVMITPDKLAEPLAGEHTFKVISRDNTNLIDLEGDSVTITLIEPTWEKNILLIDETDETVFPSSAKATDAQVDSFYADLFNPDLEWDFYNDGMPPKNILGQYKLIIWHADNNLSSEPHHLPSYAEDITDYLNVGGNFLMSGWRVLKSFAFEENFPKTFAEGTFVHDYLHINVADESPALPGDFTGANGIGGFSRVAVDAEKLAAFPYINKMTQVNVILQPGGFTETIYVYIGADLNFAGQPCGLRYIGTDFNVIVMGFPIYFLMQPDAKILATEILGSLGL